MGAWRDSVVGNKRVKRIRVTYTGDNEIMWWLIRKLRE